MDIEADLLAHVTTGLGSVWVTGSLEGIPYLFRVDPDSAAVEASWALASSPAEGTLDLAVGDHYVWVVLETSVVRLDPEEGPWESIDFGEGSIEQGWLEYPSSIAVDSRAAWVVVEENVEGDIVTHLHKVDLEFSSGADAVIGHTELLGTTITDLLVTEGRVWLLPFGGVDTCELLTVDPTTVTVGPPIDLTYGCATRHGSLTAGGGYLYVTDQWSESVRRLDPAAGTEIDSRRIASHGLAAFSAGTVWLSSHGAPGPTIQGHTGPEMSLEYFNYLDRHLIDLAATSAALWVIVEGPSELLRLTPESL